MKQSKKFTERALHSVRTATSAVVGSRSPWADVLTQPVYQAVEDEQSPYPLHLCPYGARRAA
ncbi:MAG: hypothetical protein QOF57_2254 [Frankiaceae bacterium]|nr:hypothetical protein [Frankiaceae bacterium]